MRSASKKMADLRCIFLHDSCSMENNTVYVQHEIEIIADWSDESISHVSSTAATAIVCIFGLRVSESSDLCGTASPAVCWSEQEQHTNQQGEHLVASS